MLSDFDSVKGCIAADRSNIKSRVGSIQGKKEETRINVYQKLLKVRTYIDTHPENSISIKELSKIGGIAEAHLSRQFRNVFDSSPYEYLIQRRIAKARDLLKHTDLSITELALEVGYSSLGSFISTFTRECRLSPARFRERYKK